MIDLLTFSFVLFQYDLPFVEVHRTTQFSVQAVPSTPNRASDVSVWNCDGELLSDISISIRYIINYRNFILNIYKFHLFYNA